MAVFRSPHNPIITAQDVPPSRPDFEVVGVMNAGVARLGNEVVLLLRVAERPRSADGAAEVYRVPVYDHEANTVVIKEFDTRNPAYRLVDPRVILTPEGKYLTSMSHLRVARSRDGIHFHVEAQPALFPAHWYEMYGIEDPRITPMGDRYYVNYSAVSRYGVATALASTPDFRTFVRHGIIFPPDNKNVAIFPEPVEGKYCALHRPMSGFAGRDEIWLAQSPDLLCWGDHRYVMGTRPGSWDSARIGASGVPFRVPEGWLEIYHGADEHNRYCLGAVLLDARRPWKVLARSEEPIMEPAAPYELSGFLGNVLFSCGVLYEGGTVKIYYGAADCCLAYAETTAEDILGQLS